MAQMRDPRYAQFNTEETFDAPSGTGADGGYNDFGMEPAFEAPATGPPMPWDESAPGITPPPPTNVPLGQDSVSAPHPTTGQAGTDWNISQGQQLGKGVDQDLLNRAGGFQGNDFENIGKYGLDQFTAELNKRAASTNNRAVDSQSAMGNALYGSGTGNRTNTPSIMTKTPGRGGQATPGIEERRLDEVGGGSGSGGSNTSTPDFAAQIKAALSGMFTGGGFNQELVDRRVSNVRDEANRNRQSTMASNRATLASRGLVGDGPDQSAQNRLDERLFGLQNSAINDIYAEESGNADERMLGSLSTAAGMSADEARNLVDRFRANTDRDLGFGQLDLGRGQLDLNRVLGQGNLALGNLNANNNFALGRGQLDLGQQQLQQAIDSGNMDDIIRVLELYLRGADQSADGFI